MIKPLLLFAHVYFPVALFVFLELDVVFFVRAVTVHNFHLNNSTLAAFVMSDMLSDSITYQDL